MSKSIVRSLVVTVAVASAAHAATLSGDITSYVLLAIDEMHVRRLVLSSGDVAVNDPGGRIISTAPFDAPHSTVGANEVRFNNRDPQCGALVANVTRGTDVGCSDPTPFTAPFADVPAACGYPAPFPACDPGRPVHVAINETRTLEPGVYGSLEIDGGGHGAGTVILGGSYVFCDVAVGRNASIEFGGPAVVSVVGNLRIGHASAVTGSAIDPETVRFFVGGDSVTIIQHALVTGVICAPNAKLMANQGVELNGRYIARDIRLKKSSVQGGGPECVTDDDCDGEVCVDGTCMPATCTDGVQNGDETDVDCGGGTCPACSNGGGCTTDADCESGACMDGTCVPATCMDGRRDGHETDVDCGGDECPACSDGGGCQTGSDCESGVCTDGTCQPATCTDGVQNGDETDVDCGGGTCPACSDGGGCTTDADCESGHCVDGTCVPGGAVCGNGIVEDGEVCDGDVPCDPSSPMGAMILCADDCLSITDFQCPIAGEEICGDCIDNDGDGLIDLDDPDCGCDEGVPMSLTKVRIRMNDKPRLVKRLKVRSIWAGSLPEGFDPRTDGVELQMNDANGTVYCANFEAGRWRQKTKRRLVYKAPIKRPRLSKPSNGLKLGRFKVTDEGQVIFKARGPRARVAGDVTGDVLIRVKAGQMCTVSSASLRSKGRDLVFP